MPAPPRACPACGGAKDLVLVEERRDPVGGVLYRLYSCGSCGLGFCEPRDPVGPDWYEKAAPLRAGEGRTPPGSDRRYRRFFEAGLTPGRILDVGCGDGGFVALACERGWKAAGVDYEARMVALARARGLDAHAQDYASFIKGRAAKEFDAVTLFDVLEHAPEPRVLLGLIKSVLKRGGHLFVTFPNAARPGLFGREAFDYPPHHFTRWTSSALRRFLEREGFVVERMEAPGPTVWWFSEHLFYAFLAPVAVRAARRALFGPGSTGALSDLYASGSGSDGMKGLLADASRRWRIAGAFKNACRVVTIPAGAVLALIFRLVRRDGGEHLYCLARYEERNT